MYKVFKDIKTISRCQACMKSKHTKLKAHFSQNKKARNHAHHAQNPPPHPNHIVSSMYAGKMAHKE
jgi:hypothetical protein